MKVNYIQSDTCNKQVKLFCPTFTTNFFQHTTAHVGNVGMVSIFNEKDVRPMGRDAAGVRGILLGEELEAIAAASAGKVKIVNVLSEEEAEGCEKGFITAELIQKYAPAGDYSVYLCGPKAMYSFMAQELPKLGLKSRRIRFEVGGEYGDPSKDAAYPAEAAGKTFNLTVIIRGEEFKTTCRADQTLLDACERAGIRAPSHCRSGECGWCHSKLVSGEVYTPKSVDGRREADYLYGYIHPCGSFPISDVELEVPGEYLN